MKNRRRTTCVEPNGRSTTNHGSSQQISSPPQMFSKATELNSHVTRICSLIQRSIHQSLLLTRNWEDVARGAGILERDAAFVNSAVTTGKRVVTTRVGSIGITPPMMHFKKSFDEVCVVDDPYGVQWTILVHDVRVRLYHQMGLNGPKTTISHINYFCKNREFMLKPH